MHLSLQKIAVLVAFFIATLVGFLIWNDLSSLALFPLGLMLVYFAVYNTEKLFIALAFFTPLSINIEEFTQSIGLFLPTEPLLFGLMILLSAMEIQSGFLHRAIWKNWIIRAVLFYLFVVFVTAITSSHPVVSFKFLLARLWFIVPVLLFGTHFLATEKNRKYFWWLFTIGTSIAILYTLAHHSLYAFGEKEGHWVMWPFFKDHTIYGAIVALVLPIIVALFWSEKHPPLTQAVLLLLIAIVLLGLFFSYTRAAWLSVILSVVIGFLIRFKVNFNFLLSVGVLILLVIWFRWDKIQQELARNKHEHTTESFDERLQSAANVTTDASNLERINRWSCAIEMFKQRPLSGFGPGTYAFEYAPFQEPENLTIISTNFGDMGNAHSEYLGALSEMGIFGLIAVLLIVTAIFYEGITLYQHWPSEDKKSRVMLMGYIMSLSTYFIHAFLNNFLDTDKAAVPIWAMCAIFIALRIQLEEKKKSINL